MGPMTVRYSALLLLLALASCAGSAQQTRPRSAHDRGASHSTLRGGEFRVVGPGVAGGGDAYDATLLFERATQLVRDNQFEPAVREYDRLLREFPAASEAITAQFNRGLCLQRLSRLPEAADAMRAAAASSRDPELVRDALFRLAVVGESAQQPDWVVEATGRLLDHATLTLAERVEALARRSAALLARGDRAGAVEQAERAVALATTPEAILNLGDDTYIAQARFLLGEATRLEAATLQWQVEAPGADDVIARRTALVTHAHVQFNEAIRVGNPDWAAAAGYRIGELYQDLFNAIVNAPLPADWDEHARGIYRERTGERLRPLLQGALRSWEATLTMAQRNGIANNAWVRRADAALTGLRNLILGNEAPTPAAPPRPAAPPATPTAPATVRPAA